MATPFSSSAGMSFFLNCILFRLVTDQTPAQSQHGPSRHFSPHGQRTTPRTAQRSANDKRRNGERRKSMTPRDAKTSRTYYGPCSNRRRQVSQQHHLGEPNNAMTAAPRSLQERHHHTAAVRNDERTRRERRVRVRVRVRRSAMGLAMGTATRRNTMHHVRIFPPFLVHIDWRRPPPRLRLQLLPQHTAPSPSPYNAARNPITTPRRRIPLPLPLRHSEPRDPTRLVNFQ
ncbi:hypothetical protein BD410DRAFT_264907 [Rickenella mellea]|uniref:Secreted protein n=1 Tax=Rickenella mellea TaxID=50990 RepID=A0A4Y7PFW2_9AGAM|nr:hypothetical protein BD410DRAFT_264907 [Rickenella mellea]